MKCRHVFGCGAENCGETMMFKKKNKKEALGVGKNESIRWKGIWIEAAGYLGACQNSGRYVCLFVWPERFCVWYRILLLSLSPSIPSQPPSTPSHYACFPAKINDIHASQLHLPSLSPSCLLSLFCTSMQQSQTPLPPSSSWLPLSSGGQNPVVKIKPFVCVCIQIIVCRHTEIAQCKRAECVRCFSGPFVVEIREEDSWMELSGRRTWKAGKEKRLLL